jgi:hypothetical protein
VTGIGHVNRDVSEHAASSSCAGKPVRRSRSTLCYAEAGNTTDNKEKAVLGKVILWISAVGFIAYGLACLVSPALPTSYAGLGMNNGDAYAEIGAMYGGLQTGFGLFCLLGALRKDLYRPALMSLVCLVGGLALARTYSTLTSVAAVGSYTYGAMVYEFTTAILSVVALRKA